MTDAEAPHWSPNQYRPTQDYTYKFTGNGELRIIVTFPFDWKPTDRRVGIVFFFGGGWQGGEIAQFARHAAYMAARGMVAACADYRVKSRHHTTPVESVRDARSAMRWFRAHAGLLGLDPQRISAGGGSAGAHLAACAAIAEGADEPGDDLSVSCRPEALVLFNPVTTFDAERINRFGLQADGIERICPLLNVAADTPPSILFYGSDDRLLADGKTYVDACRAVGVRADLRITPDCGHGFFNRDPWFKQTLRATDVFLTDLGCLTGPPLIPADG